MPPAEALVSPRSLLLAALLLAAGCAGPSRPAARFQAIPLPRSDQPTAAAGAPKPQPAPELADPLPAAEAAWLPLEPWVAGQENLVCHPLPGGAQPACQITGPAGQLELTAGSRLARFNGVRVFLGFAPQLLDGAMHAHSGDLDRNVRPLLQAEWQPEQNNRTVVIDAGHGGESLGTLSVVDGTAEKDYTLAWALASATLLAERGWQVVLTRSNDVALPLNQRVAIADQARAALFVSLHFNSAAPDTSARGLETLCLTPSRLPSTITREFEDDSSQQFPNNRHDDANLRLAARVQSVLLASCRMPDRGVRRARFPGVLRHQDRPAVLIEGGYLSNPAEARLIAQESYQRALAEALAEALGNPP